MGKVNRLSKRLDWKVDVRVQNNELYLFLILFLFLFYFFFMFILGLGCNVTYHSHNITQSYSRMEYNRKFQKKWCYTIYIIMII